jgi:hypothetical protein
MFVRFRDTGRRLQLSVIETRRINGKVRHEHIASLGSVALPLTPRARLEFWAKLHQRLAKLSNRIGGDAHAKMLDAIHERIPMMTLDEMRALNHALTVLVDLDSEAVELHLMQPAIPHWRLFPVCRSARRNEGWMQHSSGYTKRLKTTSMDL